MDYNIGVGKSKDARTCVQEATANCAPAGKQGITYHARIYNNSKVMENNMVSSTLTRQ